MWLLITFAPLGNLYFGIGCTVSMNDYSSLQYELIIGNWCNPWAWCFKNGLFPKYSSSDVNNSFSILASFVTGAVISVNQEELACIGTGSVNCQTSSDRPAVSFPPSL